jgi:hypothetical protein
MGLGLRHAAPLQRRRTPDLLAEGLRFIVAPLVESEDLVRPFSPGSTLEPGLKTFRRRGPK